MCRMWTALLAAQLSMMRMSAGPAMPCLGPYCKGPSRLHHLQTLKPQQAQVSICECVHADGHCEQAMLEFNATHACCFEACPPAMFGSSR